MLATKVCEFSSPHVPDTGSWTMAKNLWNDLKLPFRTIGFFSFVHSKFFNVLGRSQTDSLIPLHKLLQFVLSMFESTEAYEERAGPFPETHY